MIDSHETLKLTTLRANKTMYHIEFITEEGWETAFASSHKAACLLADALQDACGDDIRAYYIQPAAMDIEEGGAPLIKPLEWQKHVEDGLYVK
ncbi:MAG: hypothetical protein ACI9FJ_002220 [Alteromonadaceae bacterium]|jgi:hypothetical protein